MSMLAEVDTVLTSHHLPVLVRLRLSLDSPTVAAAASTGPMTLDSLPDGGSLQRRVVYGRHRRPADAFSISRRDLCLDRMLALVIL
jgi:hypothetical protein